jgi:hypothetical protein
LTLQIRKRLKKLFIYRIVDRAERMTVNMRRLPVRCDTKLQFAGKHHQMNKIRQAEALELMNKDVTINITSEANFL